MPKQLKFVVEQWVLFMVRRQTWHARRFKIFEWARHFRIESESGRPIRIRISKLRRSLSYIFRSVYQIDMKFDRHLRPATDTSWVVLYGGKTIPRWRTATILKIVISPYLSEKSSDFDRFWLKFVHSSRFWTGWTSRVQKEKSCIGQTRSSTERISC